MKDFNYLKQQMLYHKIVKWEDEDTYGCAAAVTIMHNRNIICRAIGNADAGNGGYYYSIASFIVRPVNEEEYVVDFVASSDALLEREEE